MRRIFRNNSLAIVAATLFVAVWLVGQSLAGQHAYNAEQVEHGERPVGFLRYLTTAHFGEATFENWESEFLQMGAYVLLTVWLRQRGSAESKPIDGDDAVDEDPAEHREDPDAPWPVRRGGWALALYRNSLSIAFLTLFVAAWVLHAITGAREFSAEQEAHGSVGVTATDYVRTSQFWFESMQNWQSEMLSILAIVVFTIFLRQQGSPESKPVAAPHSATGSS
jgi:hypothetical protein